MNHRSFGASGVDVSEVGLGAWQFGGDWGDIDEQTCLDILHAAADEGVTFIDTADVYGAGASETIIGKFLKARPEPFFVATKLGRFPDPGREENFTLDTMRRHTEASLRRLDVEALDLTQLHCIPMEELRRGEVFEHLRTLQREGKIQRFGASVESMEEAQVCLEQEGLASLQIIFNIFRQKPVKALFPEARRRGVAIIVRLPIASGLLAGKFHKDTTFAAADHRTYNRDGEAFNVGETFAGLPFEKGVELSDALQDLVPRGMTMAQMALRWILDFDPVSVVIPGASRPEQARDNAEASDLEPLSDELHQDLAAFYRREVEAHIRGPY